MSKKKLFVSLTILLYIIFALHLLAMHFYWYWMYWWYDILLHFLGGLWLGGITIWFLKYAEKTEKLGTGMRYLIPLSVALGIGLMWELFEFSLDTFIVFQANDIVDTISDLGMDTVGSLVASLLLARKL